MTPEALAAKAAYYIATLIDEELRGKLLSTIQWQHTGEEQEHLLVAMRSIADGLRQQAQALPETLTPSALMPLNEAAVRRLIREEIRAWEERHLLAAQRNYVTGPGGVRY